MIPHMTIFQRLLAWLLWRYERRSGWGGGFDDEMDGARWLLLDPDHAGLSKTYCLMRDYLYLRMDKEIR